MNVAEPAQMTTEGPDDERRGFKSDDAYRTISEVAIELNVPQHVLRFWESKFKQISPMKRGGGRRYYRRQDIDLIKRIHYLLYTQGYTIKGVQKLLARDRMLQTTVPTLSPDGSAKVSVSETIAPRVTFSEPKPAPEAVKVGETTRQTDLKLLLDKLKQIRSEIEE